MRKLLVITGGTRGIGRAIIEKFAAHEFDVATCSRSAKGLAELKSSIESTIKGCRVHTGVFDVSKKESAADFVSFVLALNKPVDVLVNNTGHFLPGNISSEPDGNLESMINSNLYSAYHVSRGLLPNMVMRNSGHVFNMCSIASFTAYANGGSYAISKFALLGMSRCLREEMKLHGIRVTAVMPGATRTESWDGTELPSDRFIPVEDVANMIFVSWSLSPRSVVEDIVIRPQLGDI